ncbi:MAG: M48 family metallopeptidase [Thermodesulfobacteriota bacterium]
MELPPYSVYEHPRAKRVILRVQQGRLRVTVPPGFPRHRVPPILEEYRYWLEKQFQAQNQCREKTIPLPDEVSLPALGQTFQVVYAPEAFDFLYTESGRICLSSQTDTRTNCLLLCQWLQNGAKSILSDWCAQIAQRFELPVYKRVQVRRQKTRWGSFSAKGTVSLNCKLLFFPASVVEYVILHEFAHARYAHHGPEFKKFLASLMPRWYEQEQHLAEPQKWVPRWAEV